MFCFMLITQEKKQLASHITVSHNFSVQVHQKIGALLKKKERKKSHRAPSKPNNKRKKCFLRARVKTTEKTECCKKSISPPLTPKIGTKTQCFPLTTLIYNLREGEIDRERHIERYLIYMYI